MAPSSSDPQYLRIVLNPARRRALTALATGIIEHMRTNITKSFETPSNPEDLIVDAQKINSLQNLEESGAAGRSRPQNDGRLKPNTNLKMRQLKGAALKYFENWQKEVMSALAKAQNGSEDPRAVEQRRNEMKAKDTEPPDPETEIAEAYAVAALQKLYPPIPTRLSTITKEDRKTVISCLLLLVLSLGHYSAHSRVFLCYITSSFEMSLETLSTEETVVAQTLVITATKQLSADAETEKRKEENKNSRRWKVGLASVAGAAVVGITGGLAAPLVAGAIGGIMGGIGLGGVASFLGIFAMNGALVGTIFGAFGAKMTGEMVDAYAKEVEDFKFLPVKPIDERGHGSEEDELEGRRLRITIGINGWLNEESDVVKPWRDLGRDSEVFALRFEMAALIELGVSLKKMVSSYAWSYIKLEILKRTVLATLTAALWPIYLLKMATSVDNPFSVARTRSEKAGQVLADALINKAQGERPVTLIGYSLGARVIYSCLKSLADRKAFGLVESVVLIGAPIPSTSDNWRVMRSVVSGKMINVYSDKDYILAFLYRATSIQLGIAGLQEIKGVQSVENLDLSAEVSGHLRYPDLIGKILKRVGFGDVKVDNSDIEMEDKTIELIGKDGELVWKGDVDNEELTADAIEVKLNMLEATPEPMRIVRKPVLPPRPSGSGVGSSGQTSGLIDLSSSDSEAPLTKSPSNQSIGSVISRKPVYSPASSYREMPKIPTPSPVDPQPSQQGKALSRKPSALDISDTAPVASQSSTARVTGGVSEENHETELWRTMDSPSTPPPQYSEFPQTGPMRGNTLIRENTSSQSDLGGVTQRTAALHTRDYDSDNDYGGIVMIDNDSREELVHPDDLK